MSKIDSLRPNYHICPPKGWMNDPNGLIEYKGIYHIFYQSCPDTIKNGLKKWGHYTTKNFKEYHDNGIAILPDTKYDRDGVYSGSAIEYNDKLYLFYTGNVKYSGDFDYIVSGREQNVLRVESTDGYTFTNKKLLLTNADYPSYLSCHVRDPKVFRINDYFYMVLGARTKDNHGALLIYQSQDLEKWDLALEQVFSDLGYMIECPDIFYLDGKRIYSFSPQGILPEKNRFKNIFSAGYTIDKMNRANYHEWDLGYDFYAPQTFVDSQNRRILIGWAGLDDKNLEYGYVENVDWKHMLTLPRELKLIDNKIYQYPIKEILNLIDSSKTSNSYNGRSFYLKCEDTYKLDILINDTLRIKIENNCFTALMNENGYGRRNRSYDISVKRIEVFNDSSITEIYLNGGEYVFTTRTFSKNYGFKANKEVCYSTVKECKWI